MSIHPFEVKAYPGRFGWFWAGFLLAGNFGAVTGGDALQAPLAMYPFGIKEGPNGTSLAMYPSVVFAFQAQGYVSKGRRFLSDAPFGRFPYSLARRLAKICGGIFPFFPVEFSIKNVRFGRSLAQLILGALSLYPFEVKERPVRRFLSDVPFGRFRRYRRPSVVGGTVALPFRD